MKGEKTFTLFFNSEIAAMKALGSYKGKDKAEVKKQDGRWVLVITTSPLTKK